MKKEFVLQEDKTKALNIADVSINLTKDFTTKMVQEITQQKEQVIKQRLKKIVGIEIDLQEEFKRRFNRFCTVTNGNEKSIYFNNGTIEGIRIVTFVKKEKPFDPNNFTIGYEETYY